MHHQDANAGKWMHRDADVGKGMHQDAKAVMHAVDKRRRGQKTKRYKKQFS